MAEWTNVAEQTVNPGESIVFNENPVPCNRGFVRHRDGSGNFLLTGWLPSNRCNCRQNGSARYSADFGANIAIPTDGTAGEISVAISVDGSTIPATIMSVTPAAVEEYFNVSREIDIEIWRNCCQTVSVRNVSDQPILVRNATIDFGRPDLAITY
jgi:hypothetical protein